MLTTRVLSSRMARNIYKNKRTFPDREKNEQSYNKKEMDSIHLLFLLTTHTAITPLHYHNPKNSLYILPFIWFTLPLQRIKTKLTTWIG